MTGKNSSRAVLAQNSRKIRIVSGSESPAKTSRNTPTRVPKPFVFSVKNEILPRQTMRIFADSRPGLCLQALSRQRLSAYYIITHKYVIIKRVMWNRMWNNRIPSIELKLNDDYYFISY